MSYCAGNERKDVTGILFQSKRVKESGFGQFKSYPKTGSIQQGRILEARLEIW